MNSSQFVLSLIRAFGGEISGRTLLQKRAYFVWLLSGIPVDLGYQAHYYGPYSATLDGSLTQMKNLGFVEEGSTGFGVSDGFEMRRYDYSLTDDGNRVLRTVADGPEYQIIEAAAKRILEAGNPNYVELSIAAKAFYILRKQQKPMTARELVREAKKFNWNIPEPSLGRAVDFLKSVDLISG